ncbi:hypothetical protein P3X46_031657 [Hevea brasiliensis]|uniref:Uncharacterized protein n=1 Tax=Hevea brasiliensis TaxID=3981 RepID=A0ABQ9KMJ1_HEVBR|nr:hypothetical protein P3X46_031657 [Hevea brasiliensis]
MQWVMVWTMRSRWRWMGPSGWRRMIMMMMMRRRRRRPRRRCMRMRWPVVWRAMMMRSRWMWMGMSRWRRMGTRRRRRWIAVMRVMMWWRIVHLCVVSC